MSPEDAVWITLAVAGTVVALLVIVLATPFDVNLTAVKVDGVPLDVRTDIRWLGRTLLATGRRATPPLASARRRTSARSPGRFRLRSFVMTPGFWPRVARLLSDELRLTVPRRLFVRARVGFDSPADTGALLGWMYALQGRWTSSTCSVFFEPDFTREVCEGELRVLWSLRPIVIVLPLLTFGIWILLHARPRGAHFRYHRDVMRSRVVGVVPAAGRGARFAEADPAAPPKMLAQVDGAPMVRRTVESLISGGVDHCVVVVSALGPATVEDVEQALQGLPVRLVVNPDPARGMFSSVQCGVMATRDTDLCVLLPGDMPFVQPSTISAVIADALDGAETITPSLDGHRGHPVACSSALRAMILTAPSDARLDHLMGQDTVRLVEVADTGVRRDVDRPQAAASTGP